MVERIGEGLHAAEDHIARRVALKTLPPTLIFGKHVAKLLQHRCIFGALRHVAFVAPSFQAHLTPPLRAGGRRGLLPLALISLRNDLHTHATPAPPRSRAARLPTARLGPPPAPPRRRRGAERASRASAASLCNVA